MRYAIIYWSRYGNGKKCVEHLAQRLKERGGDVQVLATKDADPTNMPEADLYVFSAPTEAFRIQFDMKGFMQSMDGMEGKRYGLINTHGMKKGKLKNMEKLLSKRKKMVMVAGVDFKVDTKKTKTGDGLPPSWEAKIDDFVGRL